MEEAPPKFVKHVVKRTNRETPLETVHIKDHYNKPMIHLDEDKEFNLKKFSKMPVSLEESAKNLHKFEESDLAVFRYFTPDETRKLKVICRFLFLILLYLFKKLTTSEFQNSLCYCFNFHLTCFK